MQNVKCLLIYKMSFFSLPDVTLFQVLPHTLLMLLSSCSLEEARNLLKQEPIVRQALQKYCKISAKN